MDQTIKSLLKNIKSNESLISFVLGIILIVIIFIILYQRFYPKNDAAQFNFNESSTAIFQDIQLTEDEYLKSTGSAFISETTTSPVELSVTTKPFLTDVMNRESTSASGFGQLMTDADSTDKREFASVDLPEKENKFGIGFLSKLQNIWNIATEKLNDSSKRRIEKLVDSSPVLVEQRVNEELELPKIYTVTQGDTLWNIAQKFYGSGYRWTIIADTNGLGDGNQIAVGQEISLPENRPEAAVVTRSNTAVKVTAALMGETYTVIQGECLWSIAQNELGSGLQWNKLFDANSDSITDPDMILAGQELRIPRT